MRDERQFRWSQECRKKSQCYCQHVPVLLKSEYANPGRTAEARVSSSLTSTFTCPRTRSPLQTEKEDKSATTLHIWLLQTKTPADLSAVLGSVTARSVQPVTSHLPGRWTSPLDFALHPSFLKDFQATILVYDDSTST